MHSERPAHTLSDRLALALLPLLALLAVSPLLLTHGCSCGHDFGFHLQSWLEAAQQFRHGVLYPSWATTPAFNAGEPRFLFYPPLSWVLGAWLTMLLPFPAVPAVFTALVLSGAGLSMYAVTRRLGIASNAAFFASALYLANPYMLFTAIERTAYAELLATVWIPWLLLAVIEDRPAAHRIAWPLALLWLTNAPAAVMASYTLALIGALRVVRALRRREPAANLATNFIGGAALGLALSAFYLVAAIHEQRFVQINMALVPTLSVPANFLFTQSGDVGHDDVNHQASRIAVALLALTVLALLAAWRNHSSRRPVLTLFAAVTVFILFLLEPLSKAVWLHLPELSFLQFPWRLLMILAAVFALALALAVARVSTRTPALIAGTLVAVPLLAFPLAHFYRTVCDADETPAKVASLFRTSHGVTPTDEYTPTTADNSFIRFSNPGYWLADSADAFAPNTTPNPNATDPDHDFGLPPESETLSTPAPHQLELNTASPKILVLNLRNYPNWQVTNTREDSLNTEQPAILPRSDGLIAIALRPGHSDIRVAWHTGADRIEGACLSALAALLFALCVFRSRKIVA